MNRRLRILLLILFSAAICAAALAAALLSAGGSAEPPEEPQPSDGNTAVVQLFQHNGLWGARAANGRVLIEPTWYYLRIMNDSSVSDSVLIARRNDVTTDSFGLINAGGEQLVPFLYTSFEPREPDVWVASIPENGSTHYHLYRSDGTRWSDDTWEACEIKDGTLTVTKGRNIYQGHFGSGQTAGRIVWDDIHTEYLVGLRSLTMDFGSAALSRLPDVDTLEHLGHAAADYLVYLFVTQELPEDALLSGEESSGLDVGSRYKSCRLLRAEVSRISERATEGYPSYTVLMQIRYQRENTDGSELIDTAMRLNISRNAAGAYTYSAFSDAQMNAAGGIRR